MIAKGPWGRGRTRVVAEQDLLQSCFLGTSPYCGRLTATGTPMGLSSQAPWCEAGGQPASEAKICHGVWIGHSGIQQR